MNRLRVVHIIQKLDPGGASQNTLYSVANMNRTLFDPYLIAGPGGTLDQQALALKDVGVHFCGELSLEIRPLADHDAYEALRKILREIQPHIVHTHRSKPSITGRFAASAENVPVIVHTYHWFGFHQFQSEGVYGLTVALEREACRRSNHLIFVSRANWKTAEEIGLIQSCGASFLCTGVEMEPLLKAKRSKDFDRQYGVSRKWKRVGMISSLRVQKDPLTFAEAAGLVVRKMPDVKFFLFGEGELADAVTRRASKTLGLENFLLSPWPADVGEVLANLDVLVLPSLWEGLPRILPEATICGVPVIASNLDSIRDIIVEGRNGAFAKPQDADDFAEKILQVLGNKWKVDPALSRQIQYEYDIRDMLHQEEALYLRLAGKLL